MASERRTYRLDIRTKHRWAYSGRPNKHSMVVPQRAY